MSGQTAPQAAAQAISSAGRPATWGPHKFAAFHWPKKPGNTALRHMISMGYKGKLFPVNPREKGILGLPCYKSVSDIPEPVEMCILMVAAELTVPVSPVSPGACVRW